MLKWIVDPVQMRAGVFGKWDSERFSMPVKIKLGSGHLHLPRSRVIRVSIGGALVLGGLLGFLPVLGFWMIPLGLLVLSVDLPIVRRWRRRLEVWWVRRENNKNEGDGRSAS